MANTAIGKKQDASSAITTGNISKQSVNYANTAGTATSAGSANNANNLTRIVKYDFTFSSVNARQECGFGVSYSYAPILLSGLIGGSVNMVGNSHIKELRSYNNRIVVDRDSAGSYANTAFSVLIYVL